MHQHGFGWLPLSIIVRHIDVDEGKLGLQLVHAWVWMEETLAGRLVIIACCMAVHAHAGGAHRCLDQSRLDYGNLFGHLQASFNPGRA